MEFKSRLRAALPDVDDDILAELTDHAKATYESARASGYDADEAERRVEIQIQAWVDNADSLRRRPKAVPAVTPPVPVTNHIAAMRQDIRYAWRLIKRQPGYAALLIATMALGIAATAVLAAWRTVSC